ncbi:MAG: tungstate ABC transporter substrate-binding protein WtpA [Candidatus Njordarchaeia archaeon]
MRSSIVGLIIIIVIVSSLGLLYYTNPQFFGQGEKLVIFHAGSLEVPMSQLEKLYEKDHSNVDVVRVAGGSVGISRSIVELHKTADILAVADYKVIEKIVFPSNYSDWYIIFAANEMVIAYTSQSRYADEINSTNWYEILQRSDVQWGHSDPNLDPCGYRTLLVLQLAERYYNVSGLYSNLVNHSNRVIRPKSVDLLALLESGEIDYAFEYRSVAVQHGLRFVDLPPQLDLGHPEYSQFYLTANCTLLNNVNVKGEPILYGLTIPKSVHNYRRAVEFLELLFSEEGRNIFNQCGQPFIFPSLTNNVSKVPSELREFVKNQNENCINYSLLSELATVLLEGEIFESGDK